MHSYGLLSNIYDSCMYKNISKEQFTKLDRLYFFNFKCIKKWKTKMQYGCYLGCITIDFLS